MWAQAIAAKIGGSVTSGSGDPSRICLVPSRFRDISETLSVHSQLYRGMQFGFSSGDGSPATKVPSAHNSIPTLLQKEIQRQT